ncbi:hypothetical protein CHS0354_006936 [Potamilus streckersoni]|uniref:Uncharacterized protein n=1 Tax=Potamilus streckersoni TaxID=2493646 RepID=A0AAE0WD26_9BIVA|nr:hypothetical protein CHS0354_006936 [Potamilus streckersoni]
MPGFISLIGRGHMSCRLTVILCLLFFNNTLLPAQGQTEAPAKELRYPGWGMRGYPLLIHKKKELPAFADIDKALAYQNRLAALPPNPPKAQTDKLDPYMLIAGTAEQFCVVDLFYDKRPLPFNADLKPVAEWWVDFYEYKSFKHGWVKFDDTAFYRNFNPRYLKNFNNRGGLTADYEKTVIYKYDSGDVIYGLYWDAHEFNAFEGKFMKKCLFIYTGTPDPQDRTQYKITALNVNPEYISSFQTTEGQLRFGWRGETSTAIIKLQNNPRDCEDKTDVSREPKYYYETKKSSPVGIGLMIRPDRFLRAVNYQELTARSLFRHYYANENLRADDVITYKSPLQYETDTTDDAFIGQDLKKWEQVYIHEIHGEWARINTNRIKEFGWVRLENMVYLTEQKKFPPFEQIRQYTEEKKVSER